MPGEQMQCPLCGARFNPADAASCASCPMSNSCSVLCCPRCKYSFPAETKLASLVRRMLGRLAGPGAA